MNLFKLSGLVFSIALVFGCNDSDDTQAASVDDSEARLQSVSSAELNEYVTRALTTGLTVSPSTEGDTAEVADGAPSDTSQPGSQTSGDDASFSGTTLQEQGVDEADLLKSNGTQIFAIDNSKIYEGGSSKIRFMDVSDNGTTLSESGTISAESGGPAYSHLYLRTASNQLVALQTQSFNVWDDWFSPYQFSNQSVSIQFIDTDTRNVERKLKLDGTLISSRRIDNKLYLVLRHYPRIDDLIVYPNSNSDKSHNETVLSSLPENYFLPNVYENDSVLQSVVAPDDCYIDQHTSKSTSDIITLISLDLDDQGQTIDSLCYVGSTEAVYASTQALYLATTKWDYNWFNPEESYDPETTTSIHKFALDSNGMEYRGSAEVGGHLGFRQSDKSFRFGEQENGVLRVFTINEDRPWLALAEPTVDVATRNASEPSSPVMLTLLKESETEQSLEQISQLPNTQRPDPIGKPGEQLYASRFSANKAFAVTFRVTDPLYLIDTSDPTDPYISGELEINGYSEYLQPLSDKLLLGIGKDALPDTSAPVENRGAWYQGLKLSLIDISNPATPQEIDQRVIGKRGTESAALYNHHALSMLTVDDKVRIALPVTLHDRLYDSAYSSTDDPWYNYDYTNTALHRFEIDLNSPSIMEAGSAPLEVNNWQEQAGYYGWLNDDRSVLIEDSVHYLHDGKFWSQDWEGQTAVSGPN